MARLSKQEELEISDPDAARSDFIKTLGDYPELYHAVSKSPSLLESLMPLVAVFGTAILGPLALEAFGAPAAGATLGASEGALTAAQLASLPGAATGIETLGTAGATLGSLEGGLTAAELASLPGAATGIGAGTAALTIPEVASLGSGATLGATEGALTAAEMASLPSAGATLGSLEGGLTAAEVAGLPSLGTTLGATEGALTASEIANLPSAASGIGSLGVSEGALTASEIANLPQLTSINQMIASGTAPGAAGAFGAASGLLTPAELAAASGVVTEGATPALFEMARAGKGLTSANEAVASGLGPGSAGAKAAVDGTLTAQELAAAAGTAGALNKDGIGDLLTKAKDAITGKAKDVLSGSGSGLGGALGLMALMAMMNKGNAAPASTATIPSLTATRSQLPYDVNKTGVNPNTPYRPGQGGVNYFSPTTYTPKAAGGGLMSLGQPNLGGYSDGGRLLQGPGDGVSDSIPAIIGRKQPARLANGEFVIPARIVSELGNGSTDAGAKRLYEMMDRVQRVRRKTKNVAANTKASKYLPA